jgi:ferredoxin-NADP reductase
MTTDSPFHAGEQQIQERLGVREIEPWARKVVRDHLPDQHRAFHSALPFLVAAARDAQGRPWATLLVGPEGFVTSPDPRSLVIAASLVAGDALEGALVGGADLGLLGIELATRRRNRLNGRLASNGDGALVCAVDQSFGNCPQYIREREWRRVEGEPAGAPRRDRKLTNDQRTWIAAADTFFIASGYRGEGESPTFGMDASHRGGDPGFVEVASDTHLVFPDYAGNNHFNTIGNLALDPRAGLLFVDFPTGSLLQLTGRTAVDWDSDAVANTPGAREFEAGQHLPIELEVPGTNEPVRRTYSLSGAPEADHYRITVKREPRGIASRYLHDQLKPGAILSSRRPAGDFAIGCSTCPVVLVSAGVGLTPMVSMLHALAAEGGDRPVWFVHGARDGRHHPLANEVRELAASRPGIRVHTRYSRPRRQDTVHDDVGRVDGALLTRLVSDPEAHYFLCGPVAFMAEIQDELERRGIPGEHIHVESFGPMG